MVPAIVKESRCNRVDETLMTAYGLVIFDGLAHALAVKKMAKTKKILRAMVEFSQWANSDAPRLCACSKLHFCLVSLRYTCICAYSCICAYICILVTRYVSYCPLMFALHLFHSKSRKTMYAEENAAARQLAELEKTKPEALYWNCTGKGKKPRNKSMPSRCMFTCPRFALGRIL
jgi:hypothetical protein